MVTTIDIGDLKVRSPDGKVGVDQHPYYLSLKDKDAHMYENFVKKSNRQSKKESAPWSGYYKLAKKIHREGFIYDINHPIIIKHKRGKWYACHGRHRICILRYLYGRKSVIVLDKFKDNKYIVRKVLGTRSPIVT